MDAVLDRLLRAYGRELELYEEIAELARESVRLARTQAPLPALNAVNERKQQCLREIDDVERSIALDKERWRLEGRAHLRARELDGLLSRLGASIEATLRHERETDRWILSAAGLDQHLDSAPERNVLR